METAETVGKSNAARAGAEGGGSGGNAAGAGSVAGAGSAASVDAGVGVSAGNAAGAENIAGVGVGAANVSASASAASVSARANASGGAAGASAGAGGDFAGGDATGGGRARLREVAASEKKGLGISDVLLIGILLAVGAVLKFFVGSIINFGMKPNFIIAMYCLTILLVRPRVREALIIGVLAGAICQVFPGQPYINLISEPFGAVAMALLIMVPVGAGGKMMPAKILACTFLSTLVSGFTFIGVMYIAYYSGANIAPTPLAAFMAIIFGTATINAVIVQLLYIPLKLALKK
jgi:hypothetical protein